MLPSIANMGMNLFTGLLFTIPQTDLCLASVINKYLKHIYVNKQSKTEGYDTTSLNSFNFHLTRL